MYGRPPTPTRTSRRVATSIAMLVLVAFALVSLGVTADPAGAAPTSVALTGHGYGHGHGMGQWGALGYAVAQTPYQSILDHYYGNTSLTSLSPSQAARMIRVVLTENDGNSVVITSSQPFTTPGLPGGPYSAVLMTPVGGAWDVSSGPGCAGPWSAPFATGVGTPSASPGAADLQLCQSGGNLTVPGTITAAYSSGSPRTVNTLPLEQYVAGVVPNESPSGWGSLGTAGPQGQAWGFQELEAQAVAARSYAMATLNSYPYADICDLACQTYRGVTNRTTISDLAVSDTAGQVMEFAGGAIAATQYSASTGGYTDPGTTSPPGFPGVPDTGDSVCLPQACNPNHTWTTTVPTSEIDADWPQLGNYESMDITARNGLGDWGGRVTKLTLVGSSGSVQVTGDEFASDMGLKSDWFTLSDQVTAPVVGMAPTRDAKGYWEVGTDGSIYRFGDASSYGSMEGQPLNQPIVGMAATPDSKGYWMVAKDGGIFSFGDASFFGSTGSLVLNKPIVGMASTPDGKGYWLVAADGGVFSYGDAAFHGSTGSLVLNQPVVGMSATANGGGYWLVAADGGLFAFGDAGFYGSMGSHPLNQPVVGMSTSADGSGYRLVAADGGIFSFGDAVFYGSTGSLVLNQPVAGMADTGDGKGYWMVAADGGIFSFGDAVFFGSPVG